MSDAIPTAEEQIPSIEEIFKSLEGHAPEEQVPVLAAILQAILGQMSEMEKKLGDLDEKFHGEIYGPLQDSYKAKVRGQGLEGMHQKYGAMFDPILEPLKGFGIEDPYSTLYDMLEEMKKAGTYNEADEGTYIGDQHKEALRRIDAIRGPTPKAEEVAAVEEKKPEPAPEPEKPIEAVEVEVKKESAKPKSLAEKKRSMRDGY